MVIHVPHVCRLLIEPIWMVIVFESRHSKHISFCNLFLEPHQTTYLSNIGVLNKTCNPIRGYTLATKHRRPYIDSICITLHSCHILLIEIIIQSPLKLLVQVCTKQNPTITLSSSCFLSSSYLIRCLGQLYTQVEGHDQVTMRALDSHPE
jgi:hypothetical protein